MRRPSLVLGAALALGLTALFMAWPPSPSSAVETCGPAGQSADAKVILKTLQFQPSTVNLPAANMSVCWEHQDGQTPHSITFKDSTDPIDYPGPSCTPTSNPDECFQQGDQALTVIFTTGGNFNYFCKIHATMTGVVNVAGAPAPGTTTTRAPSATTSTTRSTTGTTVGTLTTTSEVTTTTEAVSTTVQSTTTTLALTTQTTAPGTALSAPSGDDDDEPSALLQAVGAILLLGAIGGLIPAWRRLT